MVSESVDDEYDMLLYILSFCIRCRVQSVFFFQAEDGIRDLVRSRGLGDVYKRQVLNIYPKTKVMFSKFIIKI